jgi:hypothetical protein
VEPTEVCCNVRWRGHGGLVSGGRGVGVERGDDDKAKVTAGVEPGAEDGGGGGHKGGRSGGGGGGRGRQHDNEGSDGRPTMGARLGKTGDRDIAWAGGGGGGTRKCGHPPYILRPCFNLTR